MLPRTRTPRRLPRPQKPVYETVVDFSAKGPTRGQLRPVTQDGRVVMPRKPPPQQPVKEHYEGEDGDVLRRQPEHHRKRWTDAKWLAYEEAKRMAADSRREPGERAPR